MRSLQIHRIPFLSLVLFAAVGRALTREGLSCPTSDDNGSGLKDAVKNSGTQFICTYSSGADCIYSDDGTIDPSQTKDPDNVCPNVLAGFTSTSGLATNDVPPSTSSGAGTPPGSSIPASDTQAKSPTNSASGITSTSSSNLSSAVHAKHHWDILKSITLQFPIPNVDNEIHE
ncbi:hypothetical protein C8R45DRAFT_562248 [Mycena sanguinolenta]|nr:hypothetical protein C8R45DRAFT_562248 [Mycena sanguinolenta]